VLPVPGEPSPLVAATGRAGCRRRPSIRQHGVPGCPAGPPPRLCPWIPRHAAPPKDWRFGASWRTIP